MPQMPIGYFTYHLRIDVPETKQYSFLVQPFSSKCMSSAFKTERLSSGDGLPLNITPYAWMGSALNQPNIGEEFEGTQKSGEAEIGTETENGSTWSVKVDSDGWFEEFKETAPTSAPGKFEIDVPRNLKADPFFFIGLGLKVNDLYLQPNPVSVVRVNFDSLKEDLHLDVESIPKFYMVEGRHEPGVFVDFDAVTKNARVIDFSAGDGKGKHIAHLTIKEDGSYEVKYE